MEHTEQGATITTRPKAVDGLIQGVAKPYRPFVVAAVRQGWKLTRTGKGHIKLTAPDGRATPVPGTSTAPQMLRAWKLRVRKMGLVLE